VSECFFWYRLTWVDLDKASFKRVVVVEVVEETPWSFVELEIADELVVGVLLDQKLLKLRNASCRQ